MEEELQSAFVKKAAIDLGSGLCRIASVERFKDAPSGYHPQDVLPECRSVIVLALPSLNGTFSAKTTIPYTVMRNLLYHRLDAMSLSLSSLLESKGALAVPIPAGEPCTVSIEEGKIKGIISLKHAAVLAGMGKMGRNTLLINDRYGNMLWLGGVLTTAELEPDPVVAYEACPEDCSLCLRSCPVQALDGISINQQECGKYAFRDDNYGGWRIECNLCRRVCPRRRGMSEGDGNPIEMAIAGGR